ncbi:MAG: hypothetical protein WAU59_17350, partial [Rhodoplanes sp.]
SLGRDRFIVAFLGKADLASSNNDGQGPLWVIFANRLARRRRTVYPPLRKVSASRATIGQ